jgi:hypothetical protein
MKYQDCVETAQAPDQASDGVTGGDFAACDAQINPFTGLATDYLNHFNEAIMLLEMLPRSPDCRNDLLGWRPMSYREHFANSRFKGARSLRRRRPAGSPRTPSPGSSRWWRAPAPSSTAKPSPRAAPQRRRKRWWTG